MIKSIINPSETLGILLLFIGLIMTACEEDPIDNFEYSEGLATWSLDKITATTATFSGHLDVPASDLSSGKVMVCYSSAETINLSSVHSATVTAFDNQQNFTVTLTNLNYNTKYNCCVALDINSRIIYGEISSFTTENVTFSECSVIPSSYSADVKGSLVGLSEEDVKSIQVGVMYSSDPDKMKYREGSRVNATEISPDGTFLVSLSDLTADTMYYYCIYLCQKNTYVYETTAEFSTLNQPYDLQQDLDMSSAEDLSLFEPANCYIVSETGLYKFKTVKGNSNTSVGDVASASILWETFGTSTAPQKFDLISAFCYKDGYIAFKTADIFREGNALIAAKDASGNILWSWHIWLTDMPQEHVYNNDAGTMMDRNLGATSAEPGSVGALGLFYQWGRKDPFLGSSSIINNSVAKSTITWPSPELTSSSKGTISYVTANPTTFVTSTTATSSDWHSSERNNTLWTDLSSEKSIYDPCPSGWRVPDCDLINGVWKKAGFSNATYDDNNKGISFNISSPSTTWYPTAGSLRSNDGGLKEVGSDAYYWTASSSQNDAKILFFYSGRVSIGLFSPRGHGRNVRCIQENI